MSLFVLASKDGWVDIMYDGLDAVGVDQQVNTFKVSHTHLHTYLYSNLICRTCLEPSTQKYVLILSVSSQSDVTVPSVFQPVMNYNPWMLLYFISFLLIVAFFVLNMFVGVVVENFHKCRRHQEAEEAKRREEKRLKRMEKKRRSKEKELAGR